MKTTCYLTVEPHFDSDGTVSDLQVTKVTQRHPRTSRGIVVEVTIDVPDRLIEAIPVGVEIPEDAVDALIEGVRVDV